jgi:hypothetical protein
MNSQAGWGRRVNSRFAQPALRNHNPDEEPKDDGTMGHHFWSGHGSAERHGAVVGARKRSERAKAGVKERVGGEKARIEMMRPGNERVGSGSGKSVRDRAREYSQQAMEALMANKSTANLQKGGWPAHIELVKEGLPRTSLQVPCHQVIEDWRYKAAERQFDTNSAASIAMRGTGSGETTDTMKVRSAKDMYSYYGVEEPSELFPSKDTQYDVDTVTAHVPKHRYCHICSWVSYGVYQCLRCSHRLCPECDYLTLSSEIKIRSHDYFQDQHIEETEHCPSALRLRIYSSSLEEQENMKDSMTLDQPNPIESLETIPLGRDSIQEVVKASFATALPDLHVEKTCPGRKFQKKPLVLKEASAQALLSASRTPPLPRIIVGTRTSIKDSPFIIADNLSPFRIGAKKQRLLRRASTYSAHSKYGPKSSRKVRRFGSINLPKLHNLITTDSEDNSIAMSMCDSPGCRATHTGHRPYRHSITCTMRREGNIDSAQEQIENKEDIMKIKDSKSDTAVAESGDHNTNTRVPSSHHHYGLHLFEYSFHHHSPRTKDGISPYSAAVQTASHRPHRHVLSEPNPLHNRSPNLQIVRFPPPITPPPDPPSFSPKQNLLPMPPQDIQSERTAYAESHDYPGSHYSSSITRNGSPTREPPSSIAAPNHINIRLPSNQENSKGNTAGTPEQKKPVAEKAQKESGSTRKRSFAQILLAHKVRDAQRRLSEQIRAKNEIEVMSPIPRRRIVSPRWLEILAIEFEEKATLAVSTAMTSTNLVVSRVCRDTDSSSEVSIGMGTVRVRKVGKLRSISGHHCLETEGMISGKTIPVAVEKYNRMATAAVPLPKPEDTIEIPGSSHDGDLETVSNQEIASDPADDEIREDGVMSSAPDQVVEEVQVVQKIIESRRDSLALIESDNNPIPDLGSTCSRSPHSSSIRPDSAHSESSGSFRSESHASRNSSIEGLHATISEALIRAEGVEETTGFSTRAIPPTVGPVEPVENEALNEATQEPSQEAVEEPVEEILEKVLSPFKVAITPKQPSESSIQLSVPGIAMAEDREEQSFISGISIVVHLDGKRDLTLEVDLRGVVRRS